MRTIAQLGGVAIAALAWSAPGLAQETDEGAPEDRSQQIIFTHTLSEDVILVSASRGSDVVRADNYPGSATIIEKHQIERRQVRDVAEVLRDVPGVAVGAVAGQAQIRLRGSEANHVLVLVDGIEVSDPFGGEFDLTTLQAEIGSHVEVLRGPQSALYGSDAIGGVVAYQSGNFTGIGGRIEAGTNNTLNGALRMGASRSGWSASLSGAFVSSDGEPNARALNGGGTRDIGRDSYTLSGKGTVDVTASLTLRAIGRYVLTRGDFNDQDFDPASPTFGLVIDSPGTRYENEAVYALAGAEWWLLDDDWRHDLSVQLADIRRDSFTSFGRSFGSEGERVKASYVSSYDLTSQGNHGLTIAVDWEEERYRNTDPFGFAFTGTRSNENVGLVGQYRLERDAFAIFATIRHDLNENFADATTYRLAGSVAAGDTTRLRASVGSGIKNPGFYELYGYVDGRFIGNESLRPEKSTGWEIGIDQALFDAAVNLSLTWFDSELEGEIFTDYPAPDFIATPANRDSVSTRRGIEAALDAMIGDTLRLNAAYTFIDAEEDGLAEVRRPRHIASAALSWTHPRDRASASLVVRHNGEAKDLAFTDPSFVPVRVTLDDYTLVNVYGEVRLADGVRLFARGENLLDQTYEQVFSFVSPGRSFVAGLAARF